LACSLFWCAHVCLVELSKCPGIALTPGTCVKLKVQLQAAEVRMQLVCSASVFALGLILRMCKAQAAARGSRNARSLLCCTVAQLRRMRLVCCCTCLHQQPQSAKYELQPEIYALPSQQPF
jgi:hypothetical protein